MPKNRIGSIKSRLQKKFSGEWGKEKHRAFGLGYAVNPFNGRWLGGVLNLYIPDIVSVIISLYPCSGDDGFGLIFTVNDWLLQGRIAGILSGHLGFGMWVDYFSRDNLHVGIGLSLNSGLQFSLSERFKRSHDRSKYREHEY